MKRNQKFLLLATSCLVLVASAIGYQSFQFYQTQLQDTQLQAQREELRWASSLVDQKLSQLEASVAYLDPSTVESLKRSGARYFAYASQEKGEWSLKWKTIGTLGKDQILAELQPVDFGTLNRKERHWLWSAQGDLILVSPVELADSHQLKDGFLIFGLTKDFFSALTQQEHPFLVFTKDRSILEAEKGSTQAQLKNYLGKLDKQKRQENLVVGHDIYVPFFSETTQLWFMSGQPLLAQSFWQSSIFNYSVLTTALILLLFFVLINPMRFIQDQGNQEVRDGIGWQRFSSWWRRRRESQDVVLEQTQPELVTIDDFSDYLDEVLAQHLTELRQAGIAIKTQVEDGVQVVVPQNHLTDFLHRLIVQSQKTLVGEKEKEIQIQLIEEKENFQLLYLDTRTRQFPSGEEGSLFLQTEDSLETIDGLIAYGAWLFGKTLTVARKGFCLSIALSKKEQQPLQLQATVQAPVERVTPAFNLSELNFENGDSRIEINEESVDDSLLNQFRSLSSEIKKVDAEAQVEEKNEETQVSLVDFELKDLNFQTVNDTSEAKEDLRANKVEESSPEWVEFQTGQFKIKVRSPKKRDTDVNQQSL